MKKQCFLATLTALLMAGLTLCTTACKSDPADPTDPPAGPTTYDLALSDTQWKGSSQFTLQESGMSINATMEIQAWFEDSRTIQGAMLLTASVLGYNQTMYAAFDMTGTYQATGPNDGTIKFVETYDGTIGDSMTFSIDREAGVLLFNIPKEMTDNQLTDIVMTLHPTTLYTRESVAGTLWNGTQEGEELTLRFDEDLTGVLTHMKTEGANETPFRYTFNGMIAAFKPAYGGEDEEEEDDEDEAMTLLVTSDTTATFYNGETRTAMTLR